MGARDGVAHLRAHLEAVAVRQVHVEQDDVGPAPARLDGRRGVARHERSVALDAEVVREHVRDVALVLHDENERGFPRHTAVRLAHRHPLPSCRALTVKDKPE